jgi:hypothetical protein
MHGDFCLHYARACEERAHHLVEDMLEIADEPVRMVEGRMNPGAVQHKRVRIDTRKWLASKLFPKFYGDRVAAEVSGREGGPVPIALSPMDWDGLIKRTTGQLGTEPGSPQEAAGSADEA